ncbi:MAG: hypothetical protein R6X27_04555 [Candidatus Desulfacyla sp.]
MKRTHGFIVSGLGLLFVLSALAMMTSCGGGQKTRGPQAVNIMEEKEIPDRVAVLPALLQPPKDEDMSLEIKPGSEDESFVTELVRGVINNQLSGKGYTTLPLNRVDQLLSSSSQEWKAMTPEALCKLLNVNGVIYPDILSATMLKTVAYDQYSVDAQIKMVNRQGKVLGTWSEAASKRKIAIPTSPIGAVATIAAAAMDEPAKQHMRLVVYDWGWKISQFIQDSPHMKALPEVLSVITNIDRGTFADGDRIEVEVNAEKGLTCTFDIGDFKTGISLTPTTEGTYNGAYLVRSGDTTQSQTLAIHLTKPNGVERTWVETGGTVTIDAVAPPPPSQIRAKPGKEGVSLSWTMPKEETDLKAFAVERGDSPVGEFTEVGQTGELEFLDPGVAQGSTTYYRVVSLDAIGNRSVPTKTIKSVMPFFEEMPLAKELKGALVPGVYLAEGESLIPEGETFKMGPGTRIKFSPGASLLSRGVLTIQGTQGKEVMFEGTEWKGIHVTQGGRVEIAHSRFEGCNPCLEARGGLIQAQSTTVKGAGGTGVVIREEGHLEMEDLWVGGFQTGIVLDGARGKLEKSTITENDVGLVFIKGAVELADNNIHANREHEVTSSGRLVLAGNYLGASAQKDLRLKGDILVTSLLDAPYPNGRKVVLVSDKDITPEVVEARFQEYKKKGVEAFAQRKFGDAYQALNKALSLKDNREVYLYMAYTQMILGEEKMLDKTLAKGIEAFPYEVKLYQIYAKHLTARGKTEEALAMVNRALKMNPDDETLKTMKASLTGAAVSPVTEKRIEQAAKQQTAPLPKKEDFEELKARGIDGFQNRQYQEASANLAKALSLKKDRGAYLYLAYAQMGLKQTVEVEKTLNQAIAAFPGEPRFYQLYARHLAEKGDTEGALSMVEKGLKAAPDNASLKSLKEILERGR